MNSRAKGKRGELEVRDLIRHYWRTEATRTAQHCGADGDADLRIGIEGIHVEVKRVARFAGMKYVEQAVRDSAKRNDLPVVVVKPDRKPAVLIVRLEDSDRLVGLLGSHWRHLSELAKEGHP